MPAMARQLSGPLLSLSMFDEQERDILPSDWASIGEPLSTGGSQDESS